MRPPLRRVQAGEGEQAEEGRAQEEALDRRKFRVKRRRGERRAQEAEDGEELNPRGGAPLRAEDGEEREQGCAEG